MKGWTSTVAERKRLFEQLSSMSVQLLDWFYLLTNPGESSPDVYTTLSLTHSTLRVSQHSLPPPSAHKTPTYKLGLDGAACGPSLTPSKLSRPAQCESRESSGDSQGELFLEHIRLRLVHRTKSLSVADLRRVFDRPQAGLDVKTTKPLGMKRAEGAAVTASVPSTPKQMRKVTTVTPATVAGGENKMMVERQGSLRRTESLCTPSRSRGAQVTAQGSPIARASSIRQSGPLARREHFSPTKSPTNNASPTPSARRPVLSPTSYTTGPFSPPDMDDSEKSSPERPMTARKLMLRAYPVNPITTCTIPSPAARSQRGTSPLKKELSTQDIENTPLVAVPRNSATVPAPAPASPLLARHWKRTNNSTDENGNGMSPLLKARPSLPMLAETTVASSTRRVMRTSSSRWSVLQPQGENMGVEGTKAEETPTSVKDKISLFEDQKNKNVHGVYRPTGIDGALNLDVNWTRQIGSAKTAVRVEDKHPSIEEPTKGTEAFKKRSFTGRKVSRLFSGSRSSNSQTHDQPKPKLPLWRRHPSNQTPSSNSASSSTPQQAPKRSLSLRGTFKKEPKPGSSGDKTLLRRTLSVGEGSMSTTDLPNTALAQAVAQPQATTKGRRPSRTISGRWLSRSRDEPASQQQAVGGNGKEDNLAPASVTGQPSAQRKTPPRKLQKRRAISGTMRARAEGHGSSPAASLSQVVSTAASATQVPEQAHLPSRAAGSLAALTILNPTLTAPASALPVRTQAQLTQSSGSSQELSWGKRAAAAAAAAIEAGKRSFRFRTGSRLSSSSSTSNPNAGGTLRATSNLAQSGTVTISSANAVRSGLGAEKGRHAAVKAATMRERSRTREW